MKPVSTTRKQLRQSINTSRSANGIRYLLAIWPDTWSWMERMHAHFYGLPRITPGIDRVFDLEIHNVLYDIGHLGTALSNGRLRAAVRQRLLSTMTACARTTVSTRANPGNQRDEWPWTTTPYAAFTPVGSTVRLEPREPDIHGLKQVASQIFGQDGILTDAEVDHLLRVNCPWLEPEGANG